MDGVVFSKQKATGVGVIIWDDRGRLKATMTMKLHAPLGALEVEAKAFEVGMQFAKDVGIRDVVLEGDSIIINRALCELSTPPSSMAPIIEGILDLSKDFRRVQFSHIRRQGNRPTHLPAKHLSSIVDYISLLGLKRLLDLLSKL